MNPSTTSAPPPDGDGLPEPLVEVDDRGRDRTGMWARLSAMALGIVAVITFGNFIDLPNIPLCGMKVMTGYPCPGCGMTRAVVNMGHLDVVTSWRFHPLGFVVVGTLLATAVGSVIGLVRGRDPVWYLFSKKGHILMATFVGALLLIWVLRVFIVPEWSPDPIGSSVFSSD